MTILSMFISFLNEILSMKVFETTLFDWLIIITIIIFGFLIIYNLVNINRKGRDKK